MRSENNNLSLDVFRFRNNIVAADQREYSINMKLSILTLEGDAFVAITIFLRLTDEMFYAALHDTEQIGAEFGAGVFGKTKITTEMVDICQRLRKMTEQLF